MLNRTCSHSFALACFCLAAATSAPLAGGAEEPLVKLRAVPFTRVEVKDRFWAPRQATNRVASIPVNLDMLEKSGNIRNLELAAARATNGFTGPVFMDSDTYKALEAASYSLATHPDPVLEKRLEDIIAKIAAAQLPDGYLDTHFQIKEPDKKWTNLRDWHELYCAGHLFEAAVAHYQATGKKTFLNVATKLADHIDSVFGSGAGKRMGYPGHPEIELALVKLWRVTGEQRYFNLARFFIENRGQRFFAKEHQTPLNEYDGTYWQDDVPIYDHKSIKGHAVRAAYLLSGAVDVSAETGDVALLKMIHRVWRNTTQKNMYVTGGIGPSSHNEGFTVDYDLPNLTAYQETCASVAMALWNHRLALLHGDAWYADILERSLYNGVLAGVSLDGTKFFYVNPLSSSGNHHRSPWFGCACCPPNVARTLASLGGYAYAVSDDALWVNLYIQGSTKAELKGRQVRLGVTTDYPWDGKVTVKPELDAASRFELRLRVPGWCEGATVSVNGAPATDLPVVRGYLVVGREWRTGDVVELNLPMPVLRIAANPQVKEDRGFLALQRGPLVYCLEACDQPEPAAPAYQSQPMPARFLPRSADLKAEMNPALLGGVVTLKGFAETTSEPDWSHTLYQAAPAPQRVPMTAIPYYAWDNRKAGAMQVWLPVAPLTPVAGGLETQAGVSLSFVSGNAQPQGINDGVEPKSSGDQPGALCHWWPHKGGEEWVQYTWKNPVGISGSRVYWFDDTGRGECRLPAGWEIQYRDGAEWKPVLVKGDYTVAPDKWCEVTFTPIKTSELRLKLKLQPNWAAGIHEWQLTPAEDE